MTLIYPCLEKTGLRIRGQVRLKLTCLATEHCGDFLVRPQLKFPDSRISSNSNINLCKKYTDLSQFFTLPGWLNKGLDDLMHLRCVDKLGVFHANQTSMCLDPHLN